MTQRGHLPAEFLRRMERALGGEFSDFLAAMDSDYAGAIRLNPLREGAEHAAGPYIDAPIPWCPAGRYLKPGVRPGADLLHAAGCYYVQEASAMAAAQVLAPEPGARVLDLCAAPGGKSGQLAAMLREGGALVANEIDLSRARALSGNLERLGISNAAVVSASPEQLAEKWPKAFDAIAVDAPCSGEGMFRRDPDAAAQWSERAPAGCAVRQAGILDCAARMLVPGGRMTYSTCTFSEEENEQVIGAFLARHPEFAPVDFSLPGVGSSSGGMIRLWPHKLRGDGHFVALLQKAGERAPARPALSHPVPGAVAALEQLMREALAGWPDRFSDLHVELAGDKLFAVPRALPPLDGLKVLRRGLHLARVGRGYIQPDHALALALTAREAAQAIELTAEQAVRAMAGEEIKAEGRGWTLLVYKNLPLGWGKASGGMMKNHIPKGLRGKFAPGTA